MVEGLFSLFPATDAEPWDRVGLSVGDPQAAIEGVACCLDPTPDAIRRARESGCNVLVTHHPAFLDPPAIVGPHATLASRTVWEAVRLGVSLVAMHTNLDRSEPALRLPAALTGLPYLRPLDVDGYGAVLDGNGLTAAEVAERFAATYGAPAQVWHGRQRSGDVAFCSGSLGGIGDGALRAGCSTIVGGELSYHRCLDLVARGAAVILLGHDASEQPYAELLAESVEELEPAAPVSVLRQPLPWTVVGVGAESTDGAGTWL